MWDLSSCRRSKASKTKILDLQCVWSKQRGRRISSFVLYELKITGNNFFQEFGMSISKFENMEHLLHTDIEKNSGDAA